MTRSQSWRWFVALAVAVVVLTAATTLLRRHRSTRGFDGRGAGSAASARPLEEHGGRCATAFVTEDIPCPYVGMPGPRDDYGAPFAGDPEGSCRHAGDLVMPTGELVADDPLVFLDDHAFELRVPPGTYPVIVARPKELAGGVALALLRIQTTRPVRWEIAKLPNEKPGHHFYPVDAGTGCYVDRATARTILARQDAALDRDDGKDLLELLYEAGYRDGPTASLCIDADTGGNIVVFSSGAGDGRYGVYAGYDASGALVAFVTDFNVL